MNEEILKKAIIDFDEGRRQIEIRISYDGDAGSPRRHGLKLYLADSDAYLVSTLERREGEAACAIIAHNKLLSGMSHRSLKGEILYPVASYRWAGGRILLALTGGPEFQYMGRADARVDRLAGWVEASLDSSTSPQGRGQLVEQFLADWTAYLNKQVTKWTLLEDGRVVKSRGGYYCSMSEVAADAAEAAAEYIQQQEALAA